MVTNGKQILCLTEDHVVTNTLSNRGPCSYITGNLIIILSNEDRNIEPNRTAQQHQIRLEPSRRYTLVY